MHFFSMISTISVSIVRLGFVIPSSDAEGSGEFYGYSGGDGSFGGPAGVGGGISTD